MMPNSLPMSAGLVHKPDLMRAALEWIVLAGAFFCIGISNSGSIPNGVGMALFGVLLVMTLGEPAEAEFFGLKLPGPIVLAILSSLSITAAFKVI
jgi:hypothetical protein